MRLTSSAAGIVTFSSSFYFLCISYVFIFFIFSHYFRRHGDIISASTARWVRRNLSTMPRATSWPEKVLWSESGLSLTGDRNLPLPEGCVLVDTAAGHLTCGGSYFDVLERGLNKHVLKSVIIPSDEHQSTPEPFGKGACSRPSTARAWSNSNPVVLWMVSSLSNCGSVSLGGSHVDEMDTARRISSDSLNSSSCLLTESLLESIMASLL